ncbi:MAG: hypothetical protein GXY03_13700 [Solirubrobacterales bacterium]|nr:hypothetical protein [Solirubrobacterales bacterium]
MSPSEGDGYEDFFVAASPDTAAEAPEFEGANVCRAAALSTMLGNDRTAAQMLEAELGELGFSPQLRSGDWDWGTRDPAGLFAGLPPFDGAPEERRVRHWEMVGETAEPDGAVASTSASAL